jgi:hypothetical protein
MEHLVPHLETFEAEYNSCVREDVRSGEVTYGWATEESILGNLYYISDRWNADFRIRWMIDLIKKYKAGELDNIPYNEKALNRINKLKEIQQQTKE